MMTFYFNECLPEVGKVVLQESFDSVLVQTIRLISDKDLPIENYIATYDQPGNIEINRDVKLSNLVKDFKKTDNANYKEYRRLLFAYFTKYPIDQDVDADKLFTEEEFGWNLELNDKNAFNLFLASRRGLTILSLPLADNLSNDTIELRENLKLQNWYGKNHLYVLNLIYGVWCMPSLINLKYLFGIHECRIAKEFVEDTEFLKQEERNHIIKLFIKANNKGLLFPAHGDDNIVKYCKGNNVKGTYELRTKSYGGIRVYFSCDDNILYIGGEAKKSEYRGNAQSSDIKRATDAIRALGFKAP